MTGNHLKSDKYWVIYSTFCHSERSWQIFLLGYLVCNNFCDQITALSPQAAAIFIPNFLWHSASQSSHVQEPLQLQLSQFPFFFSNNYFTFILQWENSHKIGLILEHSDLVPHSANQIGMDHGPFVTLITHQYSRKVERVPKLAALMSR